MIRSLEDINVRIVARCGLRPVDGRNKIGYDCMLTPGWKSRPACARKAAMPLPASVGFRAMDIKSVVADKIREAFSEIERNEPGMSMITKDHRRQCHCRPQSASASRTESLPLRTKRKRRSLKLKERTGNVYENKGPLWKATELSWNVYENKCT